jgi:hypothetical protein
MFPAMSWKTLTAPDVRAFSSAGKFSTCWKTASGQAAARNAGFRSRPLDLEQ